MQAMKTHLSLRVGDLNAAIAFYSRLFDQSPAKVKPGYAKFDLEQPALNLALNQADRAQSTGGALSHLGVQVSDSETVRAAARRLQAAGLLTEEQTDIDCCHALQDKVWVADPDGNRWEIFVVKVADTTPELSGMVEAKARFCC